MKYAFVLPTGDARTVADYARDAEQAGWDGFFVWEPVWGIDAWVSLTAAAMQTERIQLGTIIAANRAATTPFDIVIEGETPGDDTERAGAIVRPWVEAGATWWIEARWEVVRNSEGRQTVSQRIKQGPPRVVSRQ